MNRKDFFNIPNILGYIRILLLPFFLLLYTNADSTKDYIIAFVVLFISLSTDFFDGRIARKFDMVTDFGKVLDPIADKLTHMILAIALLTKYSLMKWFLILFVAKEIYMAAMGAYILKKYNEVNSAKWYGKVCTILIDMVIFALLIFPNLNKTLANSLIELIILDVIFTWLMYLIFHCRTIKEKTEISN